MATKVQLMYKNSSGYIELYPWIDIQAEQILTWQYKRYSGTNTYGSGNPCSVIMKDCIVLFVNTYAMGNCMSMIAIYRVYYCPVFDGNLNAGQKEIQKCQIMWNEDDSISWYSTINAQYQMNDSYFHYCYGICKQ